YLSARNLGKVNIVTASDLNTYAIMDSTNLVMTESSVAAIDNLFKA
ncbi:MAG TPA: 50S ribosomal protein L4, partial [Porphyromonadaceae bacterium]|nr:50S ribosomal protein L4 [Porphyromonadaceae bacterium]